MSIWLKRFPLLIGVFLTVLLRAYASAQAEPHQPAKRFRTHLLPAPLYFIDQPSGQIIRLETDGVTRTQVTHTAQRVTAFDLSPVDGRLVYVSNNQLIETDRQGQQPRVKVTGPPFSPPDAELAAVYDPKVSIAAPRISPDGRWIAFAWDGVKRVAVGKSTLVELVQANDPPSTDGSTYNPDPRFYLPEAWSPNGRFLLLQAGSYQIEQRWALKRLADLNSPVIEIPVACCTTAQWMHDERYLLLGSVGGTPLGLGLFDTTYFTFAALLGRFADVNPQFPPSYAITPHETRDGALLAFINGLPGLPQDPRQKTVPTPEGNQPINTGLIIDPATGALYLVGGEQHNLIWRTLNPAAADPQAVQWELWYDFGEKTEGVNLLAAGWSPQGLAFYANVGPPEQSVLYRSLNGGKTWDPFPVGP